MKDNIFLQKKVIMILLLEIGHKVLHVIKNKCDSCKKSKITSQVGCSNFF